MEEQEFEQLKNNGKLLELYKFLKLLPKGGLLHVHLSGSISIDTLFCNSRRFCVKIREDKMVDTNPIYSLMTTREWHNRCITYSGKRRSRLLRSYRPLSSLSEEEQEKVREALIFRAQTIQTSNGFDDSKQKCFLEFETKFKRLDSITSDPIMTRFFLLDVVKSLREDGVNYVEIMVNPFGKVRPSIDSIRQFFGEKSFEAIKLKNCLNDPYLFETLAAQYFLRGLINQVLNLNRKLAANPENYCSLQTEAFIGKENIKLLPKQIDVRFIIGLRRDEIGKRYKRLNQAFEIVNEFQNGLIPARYKNAVVGINLIGNEYGIVGQPTDYFKWMTSLVKRYPSVHISLHAGENHSSDGHVIDSILLGAERIGHGLSLRFSKQAQKIVKNRGICIEACILSNKLLGFIPDTEAHPVKDWIKSGISVCLNTDDPGVFETCLTDEFFYATTNFDLTLAELKALSEASIKYSFMPASERDIALKEFTKLFDGYVATYRFK